jgi:hypothetical protein
MRQITYHNSLQPMQMFFNPQSSTFTRHWTPQDVFISAVGPCWCGCSFVAKYRYMLHNHKLLFLIL